MSAKLDKAQRAEAEEYVGELATCDDDGRAVLFALIAARDNARARIAVLEAALRKEQERIHAAYCLDIGQGNGCVASCRELRAALEGSARP